MHLVKVEINEKKLERIVIERSGFNLMHTKLQVVLPRMTQL